MGGLWTTKLQLATEFSEIVGYKTGLALTRPELRKHAKSDGPELFGGRDTPIRIRSEEVEGVFCRVLYEVGHISSPSPMPFHLVQFHKYKNGPQYDMFNALSREFLTMLRANLDAFPPRKSIDPTAFFQAAGNKYGVDGLVMAKEFIDGMVEDQEKSPWLKIRHMDWADTVQLRDLFESESLGAQYGEFFDQRFINYLAANFDSISEINWRKFEGLAAEYFHREGFEVELGTGRNDNNIDVRLWPKDKRQVGLPPAILVQCKRQKEKVGKVVVKALYADIIEEKAGAGMIVTSSSLAPGAASTCKARSYPITEANRATLRKWVAAMRTPFTGVHMGH